MKRCGVDRLQATMSVSACVVVLTCFPGVASGSTPSAEGEHYCAAAEYEQWLRDNPPPAGKVAAQSGPWDRNRRTVRMIYFHPAGTEFRENVVDSMQAVIRLAQTFYGEQMAAHGYGNKTFRIETDADGEPLVHHVTGQHEAGHYEGSLDNYANIDLAIRQRFSFYNNVYLVFVDHIEIPGVGGWGGRSGKHGGDAMVKVWENVYTGVLVSVATFFGTAAHELGHAFGLEHDFRDRDNVMSYGSEDRISACAAAFLSVHPYFNDDIPLEEESLPTFEVISSNRYPSGATGLSARIKVSDAEGVHQVLLQDAVRVAGSILTCQVLSGEKDAVVEFTYDFLQIPGFTREGLLQRVVHQFRFKVVDTAGNVSSGPPFTYVEVSKHQVAVLEGHGTWVSSVDFSPDGTILAGTAGGDIMLWDVASGEVIAVLAVGGRPGPTSVVFSPDGATVAFGLTDGRVKLWDVASLEEIGVPEAQHGWVWSVAFSPDGAAVASGDAHGSVEIWDVSTGYIVNVAHIAEINSVAFSPDGTTLAAGSIDGKIVLWDMSPYFAPVYRSADLDGDGEVGFSDFVKFTAKFGTSRGQAGYDARCDLDSDGAVGFSDFLILARTFGQSG